MTPLRSIRIAAIAALLLAPTALSSPGVAQTAPSPEALAAANELFSMLSKDLVGQLTRSMTTQMWPLVERDIKGKVDAATLADLRKEFELIQVEGVSELMKDGPAIYARHFTAAELREVLAFYRTPTGQKMQRELPQVMAEFIQGMTPKLVGLQTQTQERFGKILRDRGYGK